MDESNAKFRNNTQINSLTQFKVSSIICRNFIYKKKNQREKEREKGIEGEREREKKQNV